MRFLICVMSFFALAGCATDRIKNGNTFKREAVTYGSQTDQQTCKSRHQTVWVEVDDHKECIKYYASGLKSQNPIAIVHFPGDIATVYYTSVRVTNISSSYLTFTENRMNGVASANHIRLKHPFIFVGRPGSFGSSGHHGLRLGEINLRLMDAALSELRKKYKIETFSLSGQSGGGRVVAALLNWRNDISCAVLASSSAAKMDQIRATNPGWNFEQFAAYIYDPSYYIDEMPKSPERQIYVIADKNDEVVRNWAQNSYYNKVIDAGHQANFLNFKARGNRNHGLTNYSGLIAKACADGIQPDQMVSFLKTQKPVNIYNTNTTGFMSNSKAFTAKQPKKNIMNKQILPRKTILEWSHVGSFSAQVTLNEINGVLSIKYRNQSTISEVCTGNFHFKSKAAGKWAISCGNGNTASGDISYDIKSNMLSFSGHDEDAQNVNFSFEKNTQPAAKGTI